VRQVSDIKNQIAENPTLQLNEKQIETINKVDNFKKIEAEYFKKIQENNNDEL
jgi:hypothetical protein